MEKWALRISILSIGLAILSFLFSIYNSARNYDVSLINIEEAWISNLNSFNQLNKDLYLWEQHNKFHRDESREISRKEFEENLKKRKIPPIIRSQYQILISHYKSLERQSSKYQPFKKDLKDIDFKLPPLYKIIDVTISEGARVSDHVDVKVIKKKK